MKKRLLSLLPLLFLVGCSSINADALPIEKEYSVTYDEVMPTVHKDASGHVTYLKLSPYGRLLVDDELIAGVDVPSMFYENCVAYEAAPGATLPVAVSTLGDDVVFRGWYQYNNNIYPEKIEHVPSTSGQTLIAIFDGPTGGGGGIVTEGYGFMFTDGTKVYAIDDGTTTDGEGVEYNQYKVLGYTFEQGKSFQLYDFGTSAGWVINVDGWSFGGTSATDTLWQTYLSKGQTHYTILKTFKADVYIKLHFEKDNIYFGLSAQEEQV